MCGAKEGYTNPDKIWSKECECEDGLISKCSIRVQLVSGPLSTTFAPKAARESVRPRLCICMIPPNPKRERRTATASGPGIMHTLATYEKAHAIVPMRARDA